MKERRTWLWEFSKRIVVTVTVMFVLVFLFGCILLIFYPDSMAIQFIIENIADVFKVTVVSYAVKAGFENVCKIRKTKEDTYGVGCEQLGNDTDTPDDNTRCG
ncbi:MAG: hypothetical protein J6Y86_07490 [Pseudobutyrivibrio sp.]|nr:hypothetical protein [Pseudobutyrivibrio sp.]